MKVSIITVNYNNGDGLKNTIESVVSQNFTDYEFIIIDGGSSDNSPKIISDFSEYISYSVSEKDRGIYHAMNKGIKQAHGEYCIFMNSGDVFASPESISSVFAQAKEGDIICGNTLMPKRKKAPNSITLDFLFNHSICHQCAFIKTELLRKYPYDECLKIVSDRKFFLQTLILDNCTYESVDVDVVIYDTNGLSAQNRFLSEKEYKEVLEDLIPSRIRLDYGVKKFGAMYGDSDYEKFFIEIRNRNYRNLIYSISVIIIKTISLFKNSASFVRHFPIRLKD